MYDEEHGLDGPICPKCKMVNCMSARGCAKRQTHNELTNLREKMVKLKASMSKRELEVVDARRERDGAREEVKSLVWRLENELKPMLEKAMARHDKDWERAVKAEARVAELERERDEARNAMHRREEEVVAARRERDEAQVATLREALTRIMAVGAEYYDMDMGLAATEPKGAIDVDGHCSRCGLVPEEGVTHQCPPGFTDAPDRTARLVAAVKAFDDEVTNLIDSEVLTTLDELRAAIREVKS